MEKVFFEQIKFLDPEHLIEKESMSSFILCTICQGILIKPKECTNCQRSYCEGCLSKWQARSKTCPNKCKYFQFVKPHIVLRDILSTLKFKCYNICGTVLTYEEKINQFHESKCDMNKTSNSEIHQLLGKSDINIRCLFCKAKVDLNVIKEHEDKCKTHQGVEGCFSISCETCLKPLIDKGIKISDESTQCEHCFKYFCSDCTFKCQACDKIFCLKSEMKCLCKNKGYCLECYENVETERKACTICFGIVQIKCEKCKEIFTCSICNITICQNCVNFCEFCLKSNCKTCSTKCRYCKLNFCSCTATYTGCKIDLLGISKIAKKWACFETWKNSNYVYKFCYVISYIFILIYVFFSVCKNLFCSIVLCDCNYKFCEICKNKIVETY